MSIIDDTFKRLGEEQPPHARNPSPHKPAGDPMAELGFVVGARRRRPVSFFLALLLAGAGVAVYLWLPKAQSPSAPSRSPAEAPVVLAPVRPIAGMPAIASAPLAASGVAVTQAPNQPVVAEAEQSGVVPPPSWYEGGWGAATAGKWQNAFAVWEDGVRGLPKDRMVITGNGYTDLNAFSSTLKQYVKMFPVIGVRQRHYNGQMVYRLVVFPYGGGTREMLPRVQGVFAHAGLVNASYVQARMTEARGGKPAPEGMAKAVGEAASHAGKAPPAALPEPVVAANEAEPVALAGTNPPPVGQIPDKSLEVAVNGAVVAMAANAWENRASEVREQLRAEAYAEVAKNAQALTRDFPDRWESWFWLGTAQLAQGQMDAAGATLERASKLNPKVAQIWVQRAVVAQERGDHAAAVQLLNEARELSPKSPQIYLNLGYSYDALGSLTEAEKNYLRFLSLTDGDEAYLLQRKPVIERLERKH